jgi:signal transduction histidine kinase/CheY-like chemotaxis protein
VGSGMEWAKRRPDLIATERLRLFVITDDKASIIFHLLVIVGAACVAGLVAALSTVSSGRAMTWVLLVVLAETGLTAFNYLVKRGNLSDGQLVRWAWIKAAATAADGVVLSSGAIFLHVDGELISVLAPAWAILIAVSGTVFASASFAPSMYLMMTACIAPAALFLISRGAALETAIGTSMFVFLPAAFAIGWLSIRNYGFAIAARLDIANLLEQQNQFIKRLKEVTAERTRFFSAASHDLRQPLQALDFYMSVLETTTEESARRDIVSLLVQCVDSLDRQFNAILGVTEVDAVIEKDKPAAQPLQTIIDRVIASVRPQADVKQLEIRCVPTSRWVLASANPLERVLLNLLMNAVRYTPSGSILIGVRPRADKIEIWVVDTGIGIEKRHRGRIFEDFYQVDNPERNQLKGFGLGLAIVHRLCVGMQWPLKFESAPRKGSTFKVSVPRAPAGIVAARDTQASEHDAERMQRIAVLFVDDDPLVRNATVRLLTSWNVMVLACRNGDEALALLGRRDRSRRWRALLDYRLADPDNGIRLAERIRQAEGDDIVMFLMTAETDETILSEARAKKLRVLRKPLKPINLRAALM